MTYRRCRRGAALLISMIFLAILSAWAVSICSMSGVNVQLAENQRKANSARACAESGLDVIRFWLSRVSVDGTTNPGFVFGEICNSLQSDLQANEISNITPIYEDSIITIPSVTLDSSKGQSFSAVIIQAVDAETLQVDVTGVYGAITRTISVNYKFGTETHTVFDYGVATKGPLHLSGNTEFDGINIAGESDVYIESDVTEETLSIIGNSQIAGNVSFSSTSPDIQLGGNAEIGGESGQDAIDNHVFTGVSPAEFPVPNPAHFWPYIENTFDPLNDPADSATFSNIVIPANTNPQFENIVINGVMFIEAPNVVKFTGSTVIIGTIVGDAALDDNSGTNRVEFLGNVSSSSIDALADDPNFTHMQEETGTFVMAPGFSVYFGGDFDTLNGAIAANGIEFAGNAGGTINGSVINYSDEVMNLTGNSDLYFNRSDTVKMPAGFVPTIVLQYDPASYCEVVL